MVKCDKCEGTWDTLDPFGCCPKCQQSLLGALHVCDAFKIRIINVEKIWRWLRLNNFSYTILEDTWYKVAPASTAQHLDECNIANELIQTDPVQVISMVEKWHKRNNLFFQPWDWHDEETRKIDIDEFYGTKKDNKTDSTVCNHEWVKYVGLNETFEFCKKCDAKQEKK